MIANTAIEVANSFVQNAWYVACMSGEIQPNEKQGHRICNKPILIWRTAEGKVVAFDDRCVHKRMPLSCGKILGNGNLESELVRVTLTPSERITFDVMYYRFTLDQPASFGAISGDWGDELNFTVDWAATEQVSVTGVLGVLHPGDAAEQIVGGGSDWLHTMLLVSYSW